MLNDWDLAIRMDECQTDRRQLARTVSIQTIPYRYLH